MKRKIGIGLILITNLTFIYVVVLNALLSFGLTVAELGHLKGIEVVRLTSRDIWIELAILSVIVLLINLLLTKKMIFNKKPLLTSLTITVIGIVVFVPFFLMAKHSFLDYQNGKSQLQDYLEIETITEAQIITHTETLLVKKVDSFITDVGNAKYLKGAWKYMKTFKVMFKRMDGSMDSISTNGKMFGPYKGKYFKVEEDVIEKYKEIGQENIRNEVEVTIGSNTDKEFYSKKDSLIAQFASMKTDTLDCSADFYWEIIAKGKTHIPILIQCLTDTTPTNIYHGCKNGNLNVGELSYFALGEIAEFPAFVVTQIQFDVIDLKDGWSCWSFYDYFFDNKNKQKYQEKVRSFYRESQFDFVAYPDSVITQCMKANSIKGKYKWKK